MSDLLKYNQFISLFEGGNAISKSRRIKEGEVPSTIKSIEDTLFPLIGNGKLDTDYIIIGSVGKKKDPNETSGDIDLGIDKSFIANKFKIKKSEVLGFLEKILTNELAKKLGFETEIRLMKGINVLSIGWPIEGEEKNGLVQLDLIPISDMDWGKFIFYSPDYKINESKYKSAHRNWLFQAILSSMKNVLSYDENGEIEDYRSYVLRLGDGIYRNRKTYKGIKKRLAKPKIVPDKCVQITNDPRDLANMLFAKGVKPEDIKTFESAWKLVIRDDFKHKDKIEEIKKDLIRYLTNGDYEIPSEIK